MSISPAEIQSHLNDVTAFAAQRAEALDTADEATQCDLLHLLIKRIEVDDTEVRIVYKVHTLPFAPSPAGALLLTTSFKASSRRSPEGPA